MSISTRFLWLCVCVGCVGFSPLAAANAAYTVTYVEIGYGTPVEIGPGINDLGQVVWWCFIWDAINGLRPLAHGGNSPWVYAINNQGLAVGYLGGWAAAFPTTLGLDKWVPLPLNSQLAGATWSLARGVSENGSAAGSAEGGPHLPIACLWQQTAGVWTVQALGPMPGGVTSDGNDVNNLGQVVGCYWGDVVHHAFVWQNGVVTPLPKLPGQDNSNAYRINNRGQAVGTACGPGRHAVAWETIPAVRPPVDLGGGQAFGVNDSGVIVGCSPNEYSTAAIWPTGKPPAVDLNSLIPPGSGWVLMGANSINNVGQIVGMGTFHGDGAVFLLTPASFGGPGPDLMIRNQGETNFTGQGIRNATGLNQTKQRTVLPGTNGIYLLRVQNDGPGKDTFRITGPPGDALWQVRYFDAAYQGTDVTGQMTGAGWITPTVVGGGVKDFRVEVMPRTAAAGGLSCSVPVTATSVSVPAEEDVVLALTTVATVYQPDAQIRVKGQTPIAFIGAGIYNASAAGQTVTTTTTGAGKTATYLLRLFNDGDATDSFTVTGPAGGGGWSVRYFNAATGGSDITAQVTASGWTTPALTYKASLAYLDLRAEVTPDSTVAVGASDGVKVTFKSTHDATKVDAAKGVTIRG